MKRLDLKPYCSCKDLRYKAWDLSTGKCGTCGGFIPPGYPGHKDPALIRWENLERRLYAAEARSKLLEAQLHEAYEEIERLRGKE